MQPPLIIVGQPRSGTSLLTRVINESLDYLIFDDLYVLQYIDAEDLWHHTQRSELQKISEFLFRKYSFRSQRERDPRQLSDFPLPPTKLPDLRAFIDNIDYDQCNWAKVIEKIATKSALLAGRAGWGYKTPQDHLHFDKLNTAFPNAIFVFVLRDPRSVFSSYKNQRKIKVAQFDPRRYNPLIQGAAWKLAADSYFAIRETLGGRVHIVQYEKLVSDPNAVLEELGKLVGMKSKSIDLSRLGNNSSFRGQQAKAVTETELWLADLQIAETRRKLNYNYPESRLKIADLPEVARIISRSIMFYATQVITDGDRRKRVMKFLHSYFVRQARGVA
jgi:hypothetical protein